MNQYFKSMNFILQSYLLWNMIKSDKEIKNDILIISYPYYRWITKRTSDAISEDSQSLDFVQTTGIGTNRTICPFIVIIHYIEYGKNHTFISSSAIVSVIAISSNGTVIRLCVNADR